MWNACAVSLIPLFLSWVHFHVMFSMFGGNFPLVLPGLLRKLEYKDPQMAECSDELYNILLDFGGNNKNLERVINRQPLEIKKFYSNFYINSLQLWLYLFMYQLIIY